MKHFLLTPEGLKRIKNEDVERWRAHGSFMKAEGPVTFPTVLGKPDAECVEGLLKLGENFTYWFTPDYRIVFTHRDQKDWKLRFEVRGVSRGGKAVVHAGRVAGKVLESDVIKTVAEVFAETARTIVALPAESNMSEETRVLAQRAVEASQRREAELAAMMPEEREAAIAKWAHNLAADSVACGEAEAEALARVPT